MTNNLLALTCFRSGSHEGQRLNLVCLNEACSKVNLCCCICFEQFHQGHTSKTLKKLISEAEQIVSKGTIRALPKKSPIDCPSLIAKINQYQYKTINKFKQLRYSINATLDQIESNLQSYYWQMNEVLKKSDTQSDPIKAVQAALLQAKSSTQYNQAAIRLQKLLIHLNKFTQNGQFIQLEPTQEGMQKLVSQSNKQIFDLVDLQITEIRNILSRSSNFLFDSISSAHNLWQTPLYQFNAKMCHSQINIQNASTVYACGDAKYQMALMEPQINLNGSRQVFRFKISKITANWIGIGIAHKKTVESYDYTFQYKKTGHGAYMISGNAGTWSNIDAQFNNKVRAFTFQEGSTITCIVDPENKKIFFVNQAETSDLITNPQQIYSLSFVPDSSNPLHPCVTMYYVGDSVQYIPATNIAQIPKYNYLFSQTLKHQQITLTNGNAITINQGTTDGYRACLLNKSIEESDKWSTFKTFSFRIVNCENDWIGIGLCHAKIQAKNNFAFGDYQNLGHGCYMISSNGGLWSSNDPKLNNILKCWTFNTGDIIECLVQLGEGLESLNHRIIFKRGKDKYVMPFRCLPGDKLYPCVMLHYDTDQVALLPEF